jgi:hypothetical protein
MATKSPMRQMQRATSLVKSSPDDTAATIERLLLDYTQRVVRYPVGRRAVVIHLSRLRPDNRRTHHIRIAANTFESLVKQFDGQIFLLQNADIVFIAKDASVTLVDDVITRLRHLFGDDPLAAELDDSGPDGFATWYDLERDNAEFIALVESMYEQAARRRKRLAAIAGPSARDEPQPMDTQTLMEVAGTIQRADLTNVMRRQTICALAAGETAKPVFREIYISIPDLAAAIMPHRDIASDRWLFQYLTQLLDKRVLTMLRKDGESDVAHSFSLNLNISTLLSREFLEFDQWLRDRTRGTAIIELRQVDVFADIGTYIFTRDFLRERGYRVCLDGIEAQTLPFVDREKLGLDLVKLYWSADIADPARAERATALDEAVERVGPARIVLAHCDSEEAVRFGWSMGLRLFQGRHVERLLSLAPLGAAGGKSSVSRAVD